MSFTETIAAARAFAAERRAERRRPNQELLATGIANGWRAPLLGAMPAGGGMSQTAVNRLAGARSQLAGLVTGGVTLLTLLFLAPLISLMPQATLAAVVIVYSVGLIQPAGVSRDSRGAAHGVHLGDRSVRRRRAARHAEGHPRRDHRLAGGARAAGGRSAGLRARPQARHQRLPPAVRRAHGRRDVPGPADAASRRAPVLRQRRARQPTRCGRSSRRRSPASWRSI